MKKCGAFGVACGFDFLGLCVLNYVFVCSS